MKNRFSMLVFFAFLIVVANGCQSAPPESAPGTTSVRETDGMTMVYVPGGEFHMGSTDEQLDYTVELCTQYYEGCKLDWFRREQPVHTVTLDGFWIDRTMVTNAQYQKCVEAGACEPPGESEEDEGGEAYDAYFGDSAYDDYPVLYVNWHQAEAYCTWAGGRLPTEAEWEYAARGPEGTLYPWGNEFDGTRLNYCDANCAYDWLDGTVDDGYAAIAPVDAYPEGASWCGAVSMAGNVWEWVADWFGPYPAEDQVNPTGPDTGDFRGLRGGAFESGPNFVRTTTRNRGRPNNRDEFRSFRCVQDVGE